MDLTSIVPSLGTSSALHVAGFPQNTSQAWMQHRISGEQAVALANLSTFFGSRVLCAAPTLEEILARLPWEITFQDHPAGWTLHFDDFGFYVAQFVVGQGSPMPIRVAIQQELCFVHATEAEAAAQLWLALRAAGHITP